LTARRAAGAGGGFNQGASSAQAKPNKTKQKSLDLLGLIWFYLVESGLFNELRAKKLKKFDSRLRLCAKRLKPLIFFGLLASRRQVRRIENV